MIKRPSRTEMMVEQNNREGGPNRKSSSRVVLVLLAVALLIFLAFGSYFLKFGRNDSAAEGNISTPTLSTVKADVSTPTSSAVKEDVSTPTSSAVKADVSTPTSSTVKANTELYTNEAHGYSLSLPKGFEINESAANEVAFVAPGEGSDRGIAWMNTEPANGRTAEQIAKDVVAGLGEGFNISVKEIKVDGTQALVAEPLPGQDPTRQVFMVHGDTLYRLTFTPSEPRTGKAYEQMEEAYQTIMSTFHFTR